MFKEIWMLKMNATKAKNEFGLMLDTARKEPVSIEKNGRAVAVVMSIEEFERMEAAEDALWAKKAEEASKEGFLGQEESEKFLADMINAKD
jgi:antitoxin Phd